MRIVLRWLVAHLTMTRGDQRDRDRQKNLAKQAEKTKGQRKDGKNLTAAKESDAEIMRRKQQEALARKEAAGS